MISESMVLSQSQKEQIPDNRLLEGVAVQGGVASTLSPVALKWGT